MGLLGADLMKILERKIFRQEKVQNIMQKLIYIRYMQYIHEKKCKST